jgi:PIN domain nuclease of toxin-antitoxin system
MILGEAGADAILHHGPDAPMSAVTVSGGRAVFVFDQEIARLADRMRAATRYRDIWFGGRACLATGLRWSLPVLTADRLWSDTSLGVQVHQIR